MTPPLFFIPQDLLYQVCDKECSCNGQDRIQLRERCEDQGLTHHVVAITDSCDTVSADLTLEDSCSQVNDTNQQTCTKYCSCLEHRNLRSQKTLHHKEADETIKTLRTRKSREDHIATESCAILLHCAYCGLTANCSTNRRCDTCQAYHQCNTDISQNQS